MNILTHTVNNVKEQGNRKQARGLVLTDLSFLIE